MARSSLSHTQFISLLLIIAGFCLILFGASYLIKPFFFMFIGYLLLNYGLQMRGFSSINIFLRQITVRRSR
ncbi:hypothetical protein H0X48_06540 [Candidatus Dependentiae bacterium]|nr:hypothetical protein [Candidatus Dependentiae bacterium]